MSCVCVCVDVLVRVSNESCTAVLLLWVIRASIWWPHNILGLLNEIKTFVMFHHKCIMYVFKLSAFVWPLRKTTNLISFKFCTLLHIGSGPGGSVGVVIELRPGRSGIDSWWGGNFPSVQTGPGAHPTSCKMGTRSFPGVKLGRGVLLTTHPLLVPRSWNSRAIPLPTLWATPVL